MKIPVDVLKMGMLSEYVGYYPYGSSAISKNGKYLFSTNDGKYILITNFSFPATEYFVLINLKGSYSLAISPSGKYLYAHSASGNTSIYYISPVGEYLLNGSAGNIIPIYIQLCFGLVVD